MHHVLYQTRHVADLRDHERCVLWLDPKHDAHLELHGETIFRDDLERIEGICDLTGRPFDGLVRRRDDDRRYGQSVDVITSGTDDHYLDAAVAFRNDVRFVSAAVQ